MRDLARVEALLDVVNRDTGRAWRLVGPLPGGRKSGACEVEDDGQPAVLKVLDYQCSTAYLDDVAATIGVARSMGWPTPAWHAWGLDGQRHPYTLAEFVDGGHPERLDDAVLDALLDVVERQRGIAARSGVDRVDAWTSVFGDGSRWRAALERHSPEALVAGETIARLAGPFRHADLPSFDLVHTDFGLHNVLWRDGAVVGVVDVEGIGRGAAAIDLATLLFSAHSAGSTDERVLERLVAHALTTDGVAALAVSLASALFDWAIYATDGLRPDEVISFLTRAASLFGRFA